MNELAQAIQVAGALPEIQRQEVERVAPLLYRLPIAELSQLGDALEHKQPGITLRAQLMREYGERVRVAEWYVDAEGRCQHRQYQSNDEAHSLARIGEIGDHSWIEAWIA